MTVHDKASENIQRLHDGSRRRFLKASSTFGLAVVFRAGTMRDAFAGANYGVNQEEEAVTKSSATQRTREEPADKTAIRTFPKLNVPEIEIGELRRRIKATRWPEPEYVSDQTQGVQLATMQKLARYWATEYDWRKIEAKLNALPQFVTEIDGLDIHFIHVRSKHANALPIIVTHGWPGSIIEQMKIVGPLTDPTAHGGKTDEAFDVVIPSIPGYGYSGKSTTGGWDPARIARAWIVLMKRLGYTRFVAQGGDWGAAIVEQMALQAPRELLGIHTNMAGTWATSSKAKALRKRTLATASTHFQFGSSLKARPCRLCSTPTERERPCINGQIFKPVATVPCVQARIRPTKLYCRSDLNDSRSSFTKISGCSHAAKCPPLSSFL